MVRFDRDVPAYAAVAGSSASRSPATQMPRSSSAARCFGALLGIASTSVLAGSASAASRQRVSATPRSSSDAVRASSAASAVRRDPVVAMDHPLRIPDVRDDGDVVGRFELRHAHVAPLAVAALPLVQRDHDRRGGLRLTLCQRARDHVEAEAELEVVPLQARSDRPAAAPDRSIEVEPGHDALGADDPCNARTRCGEAGRFEHPPVVRELEDVVRAPAGPLRF